MKWSQYNHITKSDKHGIFIFNSVTNSFVKINDRLLTKIEAIQDWDSELKSFDDDFIQVLTDHRIIVPENFDSDIIYNKKYLKYISAANSSKVVLTIATTTGCNFKCPYCYEKGVEAKNMSLEVEDAIIKYIESAGKPVEITWYGGEPLMNWGTIERLTQRISKIKRKEDVSYILVTNGYALTPEKCDFFTREGIRDIQITLDGVEDTHNASRISKDGKPSYQRIMDNINYALKVLPNTFISIRVNIGPHNKNDYPKLRNEIYRRWGDRRKNIGVHFSFIIDYKSCHSYCLTTKEQMDYVRELYEKEMIITNGIFPTNNTGICCANKSDSYVIAPDGTLYKCWVDIGKKERAVGTIFEPSKPTNFTLLSRYFSADKFSNPKCLKCFLLPLCSGVCPAIREVSDPNDFCPFEFRHIDSIMEILYDIMHSAQDENSKLVQAKKIIRRAHEEVI